MALDVRTSKPAQPNPSGQKGPTPDDVHTQFIDSHTRNNRTRRWARSRPDAFPPPDTGQAPSGPGGEKSSTAE
ncbi:hypothetical protein PtA15_2A768 [Puccinia triticina]|uniref:Uncharacterized protein n=1 Tax=Puccinia triticina TaxID=208348 RepID=A0ABY7CE80_9BASI|nr:uncharacterized protein PtA15_2A768 [Puccinia triticina]WAQ82451.1 hypothetical protein PtA15_2A768 [Puccinia triticina]WAR53305.1 hypothetical protein PtB15_2B736 [Puccinia triticina]